MKKTQQLAPFHSARISEEFRSTDGIVTLLASSTATGGNFTVAVNEMIRGHEPPPHVREHEDEYFYILDGKMTVYCGTEVYDLERGDLAFLPHGVPQAQRCVTPTVRVLVNASSGDGSRVTADQFLRRMSDMIATHAAGSDPSVIRLELARLASEFGIRPLSPDEVKSDLPQYLLTQTDS